MRLQRIYSSKLYVTSTRKDRIRAAIQDPINVELVKQLADYLDDEAKAELKQAQDQSKANAGASGSESTGGVVPSGDSSAPSSSGGGHSAPAPFTGDIMSDFGDDELADIEIPDDAPDMSAEAPAEEVVESVTQEGKPITATSVIWTTVEDIASACDMIKGTLNAREDTSGVSRIEVKDSQAPELWVYYNDDSNLNDKMIEVISVLNSIGYTCLKFNRLARSNNAIVFDVMLTASESIKSVKEVREGTK